MRQKTFYITLSNFEVY